MSALFQNVLTASFHGSIVIIAVLLLRLLLGKAAPKKYLCYLWVLVGVRLLMPFDIQSPFSLQPESPPQVFSRWEQPAAMKQAVEPAEVPNENVPRPDFFPEEGNPESVPPEYAYVAPETAPVQPSQEASVSSEKSAFSPVLFLALLWGGVAVGFLAYNFCSYAALRKRVRDAKEVPGGWETDGIETAFILGFIKPKIYIPAGMSPETQQYILAHERTHLDKADHWIKMLGFLALAIHWFNPLVWVAYYLLCKDIEMACDERVVQFMDLAQRKAYSTALLNCSSNHAHYAVSPVAFGEVNVKKRIQSILNYRSPSFWSGLLSVIAIIMVTVCLLTNPTRQSVPVSAKDFSAATQPPMEENPDWGISLLAQPHSPTSLTLYYAVGLDSPYDDNHPVTKEASYCLEAWNGKTWEPLTQKVSSPDYSECNQVQFSEQGYYVGSYLAEKLDWMLLYGALPEGDYRIAVPFLRDDQTQPFYAWFHIYANALAGEEAEALARVEAAVNLLKTTYNYTATISESSSQGQLIPVTVICKSYDTSSMDFYTGPYCYASRTCPNSDSQLSTWMDAFLPGENTYVSFPKASGKITDEEICFTASLADSLGEVNQTLCTYRMGQDGRLSEISLLTQSQGEDGVLTQSQRTVSIEYVLRNDPQQSPTPKNATEALQESPWGISFQIPDYSYTGNWSVSPTGCQIQLSIDRSNIGVSQYTTDESFWLEKWDENFYSDFSRWKPLEAKAPISSDKSYRLTQRALLTTVDWSQAYGSLEPGFYRMGKRFSNGEETIIQYAEFLLYSTGSVQGAGGEEAMKRVYDAIDTLCAGSYCVRKETIGSVFPQLKTSLDRTFWKSGELRLTEYPAGYTDSHLVLAGDEDQSCRDMWLRELELDSLHQNVFFPEGDSVITAEEVSFNVAATNASYESSLTRFTFRFDESGAISSIEVSPSIRYSSDWSTVYTMVPLSDSEIQGKVEELVPLIQ